MANATDAHGKSAERIALNAKVVSANTALSAGGLDQNGASDLRLKMAESNYRLNACSTASGTGKSNFDTAFGYSGFGLEIVST